MFIKFFITAKKLYILAVMNYIDLFAGCGGLSLGLHNAGWEGLFAIEKSPDAFATLKYNLIDKVNHFNWPEWLKVNSEPTHLDITTVLENHKDNLLTLQGQVDMITGGPPCQGFSSNGRRNEDDKRNNLITHYLEFISLIKPKILFFENVKGFTMEFVKNKSEGKKYSIYVIEKLEELGYDVIGDMIEFSKYGIPQKRNRFILVGVRRDVVESNGKLAESFFQNIEANKTEFLVNKNLQLNVNLEEAISDLLMSNGTKESPDSKHFTAGIYNTAVSSYQLYLRKGLEDGKIADSHRFVKHKQSITNRNNYILKKDKRNKVISDLTREKFGLKKRTLVPLSANETTPTLTTLTDDYIHYQEPRVLTVREYARLQSFPDTYEFKGKYTTGGPRRIHEVPRYTQIGNAIPPLFGEQSGIVLKSFLANER